jgi:hypothetical protein
LDLDPTDEEDEEPDKNAAEEAAKVEAGHEHHKGAVIDDGTLDRLPERGQESETSR